MENTILAEEYFKLLINLPKFLRGKENIKSISRSELSLLFLLSDSEEQGKIGCKMSEISKALNISKPATTQLILKLMAKKLIAKKLDKSDKRVTYVILTKYAKEEAEKVRICLMEHANFIINKLGSEEIETFLRTSYKIINLLEDKDIQEAHQV